MRFLIDAQLPPSLVGMLTERGHAAHHVNRLRLGSASDRTIWDHAVATNATIVSKDSDFLHLASVTISSVPVVWVRLGNATSATIAEVMERELDRIVAGIEAGERIIEIG